MSDLQKFLELLVHIHDVLNVEAVTFLECHFRIFVLQGGKAQCPPPIRCRVNGLVVKMNCKWKRGHHLYVVSIAIALTVFIVVGYQPLWFFPATQ